VNLRQLSMNLGSWISVASAWWLNCYRALLLFCCSWI
jgi:hypothetical protein